MAISTPPSISNLSTLSISISPTSTIHLPSVSSAFLWSSRCGESPATLMTSIPTLTTSFNPSSPKVIPILCKQTYFRGSTFSCQQVPQPMISTLALSLPCTILASNRNISLKKVSTSSPWTILPTVFWRGEKKTLNFWRLPNFCQILTNTYLYPRPLTTLKGSLPCS